MIIEFADNAWSVKSNDLNDTYYFATSKNDAIDYCKLIKEDYTFYIDGEFIGGWYGKIWAISNRKTKSLRVSNRTWKSLYLQG